MKTALWSAGLLLLLSLLTVVVRPPLPVDETRYLAVAWEAHERGDMLVSHLNSDTYAHKPPLLFWLINLMWQLTGVSEFSARLVAPLASAVGVLLTWRTAKLLVAQDDQTAATAAAVHAGCLLWLFYGPLTMFDTLLALTAEVAVQGILLAGAGRPIRGWLQVGFGAGLGILCKGPVVLPWVLPMALAAPWWLPVRPSSGWGRWYAGLFGALVLAAAVGLAWALPSAAVGGSAYAEELLFGQTAGRMVNSFAHREPPWWYLPVTPLCLLPWLLWPAVWQGLKSQRQENSGWTVAIRCSLARAGAGFVLLSLTSGKQTHYLIPLIPSCAVLLASLVQRSGCSPTRWQMFPVASGTVLLGAFPVIVNHLPAAADTGLPGLVSDAVAMLLVSCGGALLVPRFRSQTAAAAGVSTAAALFMGIVTAALAATMWSGFDVRPLATAAATSGVPAGWLGGYHGQLNFAGRMRRVEELADEAALRRWLTKCGEVVVTVRLPRGEPLTESLLGELAGLDRRRPDDESGASVAEELRGLGVIPGVSEAFVRIEFVQRLRTGLRDSFFVLVRYRMLAG
jgi:4-amino-4-deoxy-L-arabinose transferase-like glycosyltransferase